MFESSREQILSRIKGALKGGPPGESAVASGGSKRPAEQIRMRCDEKRGDLIAQFENEVRAIGGHFYLAGSAGAACEYVRKLLSNGMKKAVGWDCQLVREVGLAEMLEEAGGEFTPNSRGIASDEFLQKAMGADVGVTAVDYALSDTGTLVVLTGQGRARVASLLPPIHVALVKPEQVISGLEDLFALLKTEKGFSNDNMSSAVTFITGPSRTADIEMTLVVGVHGPQQLHVILLND